MKTNKILESRQPVRRPRFCANSPRYKYQGVQTIMIKFYIVYSVRYEELNNSRNNNKKYATRIIYAYNILHSHYMFLRCYLAICSEMTATFL